MKLIPLTQGKCAQVDDEDYDYLMQWKWFANRQKATFYAKRNSKDENGKWITLHMHRVILGVTDPKIHVDHEDHSGLNNQKYNIRKATPRQNAFNKLPMQNSTSRYLGVCWDKSAKKWISQMSVNKRNKLLGRFDREDHAALEYNQHALAYYGEFANLNAVQDNGLFQRLMSY